MAHCEQILKNEIFSMSRKLLVMKGLKELLQKVNKDFRQVSMVESGFSDPSKELILTKNP